MTETTAPEQTDPEDEDKAHRNDAALAAAGLMLLPMSLAVFGLIHSLTPEAQRQHEESMRVQQALERFMRPQPLGLIRYPVGHDTVNGMPCDYFDVYRKTAQNDEEPMRGVSYMMKIAVCNTSTGTTTTAREPNGKFAPRVSVTFQMR